MLYLNNSESRLLDNFRSLTDTGKKQVIAFSRSEVFRNPVSKAVSTSSVDTSDADNLEMMTKYEQSLIALYRRCNAIGCQNIEGAVEQACTNYRNPNYITAEEKLLLDYFRKSSTLDRFRIIQAVTNSADNNSLVSDGSHCKVVSLNERSKANE